MIPEVFRPKCSRNISLMQYGYHQESSTSTEILDMTGWWGDIIMLSTHLT